MKKKTTSKPIFPLADAQLAVEIAAVRDQLLSIRVRITNNAWYEATNAHLDTAARAFNDALHAVLTVEKS